MKKTSKTKIANIYATAIYEAAKKPETLLKDVNDFVGAIDDDFVSFIANPIIGFDAKKQVIEKLKISNELKKAVGVIIENNRASELVLILSEFVKIYYQKNNISQVDVISTYKLNASELKKIDAKLQKKINKKVVINNIIDPNIFGGLIVKYDSKMIDASVLGKLNTIEKLMKGEGL